MNTIGSVLGDSGAEISTHFADLHGSLDRLWFATILGMHTTLTRDQLLEALRYAYTRCQESFNPNARTKAHSPTVVATKHVHEALAAAVTANGWT